MNTKDKLELEDEYREVKFHDTSPPDIEPSIAEARRMLELGASLDDVWRVLRTNGLDIFASAIVTTEVTEMAFRDAKRAVYASAVWDDDHDTYNFWEQLLEDGMRPFAEEESNRGYVTFTVTDQEKEEQ